MSGDKKMFDPDEVSKLLTIAEKAVSVTGRSPHIVAEAMSRLEAIETGLMNEHRKRQGLEPVQNPMVEGAQKSVGPEAEGSDQLDANPTASKPLDQPKSQAAKANPDHNDAEPKPAIAPGDTTNVRRA